MEIKKIIERLLKEKDSFYDKNELQAVLDDVISKIEKIPDYESYIYRGEPECYKVVSSNLYRQRKKHKKYFKYTAKEIDLAFIEKTLVELAQRHHRGEKNSKHITHEDTLDAIQHWGGETNRIDFTEKIEIALFFACSGSYDKDGRVLLKKRSSVQDILRKPEKPEERVEAQKSIFVIEPKGIIDPDYKVSVPQSLKCIILKCLSRLTPSVSIYTMYAGIFGFVKFKTEYRDSYFKFIEAYSLTRNYVLSGHKDKAEQAVKKFNKIIKEIPFISDLHLGCGIAHATLRKTNSAIKCFSEALSWKPDDYESRILLGKTYLDKIHIDKNKFANLSLTHFNNVPKNVVNENYDYYIHRGKAHINLGNYKHAARDFDQAICIIKQELNKRETSDELAKCEAHYFMGETLLCLNESDGPIWRPSEKPGLELQTLNKFDVAKECLTAAKQCDPDIYNNITGPVIGAEGFKKKSLELPDEIVALLKP